MSPTLVVPPATAGKLPDIPDSCAPPAPTLVLATMFPSIVGTPLIENEPAAPVMADFDPLVVTAAHETGLPSSPAS
jgi:hypothetical protein